MTFGGQAGVGTSVETGELADEAVTNAKVSASAAIDLSKLASDPLARANHTGTQLAATLSDLGTAVLARSQHTGTQLAATLSDLATAVLARAVHTGTQLASTISDFAARVGDSTSTFTNKTFDANGTGNAISNIENADIAAGAAIALSKLASDPVARANNTGTQLAATVSDFATAADTRIDLKQEKIVRIPATAGALGTGSSFQIAGAACGVRFDDAATEDWGANFVAPLTVNGLTISSIRVFYESDQALANVVLDVQMRQFPSTQGTTAVQDTTGTDRAYATNESSGQLETGIITLNADVYDAFGTWATGDIGTIVISRIGGAAADTVNAEWVLLAVEITWA